jgi:transcriptional regulator with XRE-family HTH domain
MLYSILYSSCKLSKSAAMSRRADPIDAHVAQRLRLRRELTGYTQDKLGQAVGVSFQMIQKYENGTSRVGASRLLKIAKILGVSVAWFFEGFMPPHGAEPALAQPQGSLDESVFQKKETLDLLKAYYALPDSMRKHVLGMVQGMCAATNETPALAAPVLGGQAS